MAGNEQLPCIADRFEIDHANPLPDFDGLTGKAFMAHDRKDPKAPLFGLIIQEDVPARYERLTGFKAMNSHYVANLVSYGSVYWEPDKCRRMVMVCDRPQGKKLWPNLKERRKPMSPDAIKLNVIKPISLALKDIHELGLCHGGVRPNNMYMQDVSSGGIMLGEAASVPCGYGQPTIFETTERGMAYSIGRGEGKPSDDIYALGITALLLCLGVDPSSGVNEESIVRAKIEQGTFPALVPTAKIHSSLTEPLRGMLTDIEEERWTVEDIELWLSGRRLSPIQATIPRTAPRPFQIENLKFWHIRTLANAFTHQPQMALKAVDTGELDRWLRRTLSDDQTADKIAEAISTARATGRNAGRFEDRMLSRVAMVLDPKAPIRYKNVTLMPEGLGPALAAAVASGKDYQPLVEVLLAQLPMFWYSVQKKFKAEFTPLIQRFDRMRSLLERPKIGFGMERVVYEMNPDIACLSPLVKDFQATSVRLLLMGLEKASEKRQTGEPMDRHIAAFICSQAKALDDSYFNDLDKNIPHERALAMMNIYGQLQEKLKIKKLPNLCGWLATLADTIIKDYKSAGRRKRMQERLEKTVRTGDINKLLALLDDPKTRQKDRQEYSLAKKSWVMANKEEKMLHSRINGRDRLIQTLGRQIAATASGSLAVLIMVGIVLVTIV